MIIFELIKMYFSNYKSWSNENISWSTKVIVHEWPLSTVWSTLTVSFQTALWIWGEFKSIKVFRNTGTLFFEKGELKIRSIKKIFWRYHIRYCYQYIRSMRALLFFFDLDNRAINTLMFQEFNLLKITFMQYKSNYIINYLLQSRTIQFVILYCPSWWYLSLITISIGCSW